MLQTFLILLAVSLDVFAYSVSMGTLGIRFNARQILGFLGVSIAVFSVAMVASGLIKSLINKELGNAINGIVLILFGIYYLLDYESTFNFERLKFLKFAPLKQKLTFLSIKYSPKPTTGQNGPNFSVWQAIPVNLDAFFTASITGSGFYSPEFAMCSYVVLTALAVVIGNNLSFSMLKRAKINYSWLCAMVFIGLVCFKLFGI